MFRVAISSALKRRDLVTRGAAVGHGNREPEATAVSGLTVDTDRAAHEHRKLLGDNQAQPRAALAGAALERAEQVLAGLGRKTRAVIAHDDLDFPAVAGG